MARPSPVKSGIALLVGVFALVAVVVLVIVYGGGSGGGAGY